MKRENFQRHFLKFLFLFLLSLSGFYSLNGQTTSIFASSPLSKDQLNSYQSSKLNKLSLNSLYDTLHLINVGNLATTQVNGKIRVVLPDLVCPNLIFSATNVDYINDSDYYWYGIIESDIDSACNDGSLTMMSKNGEKFGSIIIDSTSYEYFDLGSNLQALARFKLENISENDCAVNENTISSPDTSFNKILPCQGDCQVRILVLWTEAAASIEANINNKIALAIAQTNQAIQNSLVDERDVKVVLAGSQMFNFVEGSAIETDAANLTNLASAQSLRNSYQADLVVLLTNGINGNYSVYEGYAQAIGPNFSNSYAIVQVKAATGSRFVFSHEVGHLFGGRHDTKNDPAGTIEHGYIFRTGFLFRKRRYTIMASTPGGKDREQFYSNPNLRVRGTTAGTVCCNNVAQMLRNNGCNVANFFVNNNSGFNIDIINFSAPYCVNNQSEVSVEALVQCGTAPYTYAWQKSYDGINWIAAGNTAVTNFPIICNLSNLLWIRLTVIDANGATLQKVRTFPLQHIQ